MLTLPNFLTLLRIIAIPVFLILLANGNHAAAFMLFLGAGVTDTVDGALARLTDSRSELGAVLDPMADKLLLLSSFVVLGASGVIPVWLAGAGDPARRHRRARLRRGLRRRPRMDGGRPEPGSAHARAPFCLAVSHVGFRPELSGRSAGPASATVLRGAG
jgi:hypothetical protein